MINSFWWHKAKTIFYYARISQFTVNQHNKWNAWRYLINCSTLFVVVNINESNANSLDSLKMFLATYICCYIYVNHRSNFQTWLYSAKVLFVYIFSILIEIWNCQPFWFIDFLLFGKLSSPCFILSGYAVKWMFVSPILHKFICWNLILNPMIFGK